MSNKKYLECLYVNLYQHKQSVLRQKGKCDIEPADYNERVDMWYDQIFEYVENDPPIEYVKAISVYQDSEQNIKEIHYAYCGKHDRLDYVAINIFWI